MIAPSRQGERRDRVTAKRENRPIEDALLEIERGAGPLVATAVHDGHAARPEVEALFKLEGAGRLREEDPFTGRWTSLAPTRVIGRRTRFEVDLNRPREKSVYRRPEDAWGLDVWKQDLPADVADRSLAQYDSFYAEMRALLRDVQDRHGHFVVYDLHTYNHRREGPNGPEANAEENPQVNIGTGTMDRNKWGPVVDALIDALRAFDFPGGRLDVRENVKFRGGNWPRWIHETFPDTGVAIAIEFKKFFMDEWSGEPQPGQVEAIEAALHSTVGPVLERLRQS